MNKQINFEDNIFILNVQVRMLRDLLTLETDPELFLKKTTEDIAFIDTTLETLLTHLIEHSHLIERTEQLNNLFDLEWQFAEFLGQVLHGGGTISALQFPALEEQVLAVQNHSTARKQRITESGGGREVEPLVSTEELEHLLKAF